jgi:hypothetical protein
MKLTKARLMEIIKEEVIKEVSSEKQRRYMCAMKDKEADERPDGLSKAEAEEMCTGPMKEEETMEEGWKDWAVAGVMGASALMGNPAQAASKTAEPAGIEMSSVDKKVERMKDRLFDYYEQQLNTKYKELVELSKKDTDEAYTIRMKLRNIEQIIDSVDEESDEKQERKKIDMGLKQLNKYRGKMLEGENKNE